MSCLCYNISVIFMKNNFEYYIKYIKPLEKKYSFICHLYSYFNCKYLYNKKKFYNKLLIFYYKTIQKNDNAIHNFKKNLNI